MTFDFIARKFAQPVAKAEIDFSCKVCGVQCDVAPADGSGAICPDHCEDHDYVYEAGEGHRCKTCNAYPPDDWFDRDD